MKPDKKLMNNSPLSEGKLNSTPVAPVAAGDDGKKKSNKPDNKNNSKNKNVKKENFFIRIGKRIGRAFVGMYQEMKNVSWPTLTKALSSTGIVLAVVCFFFVILLAFDSGLGELFKLVVGISE